jgi:hypothetical protein
VYVDIKNTTWERFHIDDEHLEEVKELMNEGFNPGHIDNMWDSVEQLVDVSEWMSLEDNDGEATAELHHNDKLIKSNKHEA